MSDEIELPIPKPSDVIFDPDDDRKVVDDTLLVPFSSVCRVQSFKEGEDSATTTGTGWIINPLTIITAGHVVYDRHFSSAGRAYANRVEINPSYDKPNGIVDVLVADSIRAHSVFEETGSVDFDIAVLRLSTPLKQKFLPFPYSQVDDHFLLNAQATVAGYPLDVNSANTMVHATGLVVGVDTQRLIHKIDTEDGQSGAPLWIIDSNGNPMVVGIHVQGFVTQPVNTAVRLSESIEQWIDGHTLLGSS